jgi:hypothetical protein
VGRQRVGEQDAGRKRSWWAGGGKNTVCVVGIQMGKGKGERDKTERRPKD